LGFTFDALARSLAAGLKFMCCLLEIYDDFQITQPDNMAAEQRKLLGKTMDAISLVKRSFILS
jgi:hypothetical protein